MRFIRPFTDRDYPAWTAICAACARDAYIPFTEAELRHRDARRSPEFRIVRFAAELDGAMVGVVEIGEIEGYHAPGRWLIKLQVMRSKWGQGIGRALWQHAQEWLSQVEVSMLWSGTVEGTPGEAFAARRGFTVVQRESFSRLDVRTFDPAPFATLDAHLAARGLRIACAADLLETDPEARRRWWDIDWACEQDIPAAGAATRLSYDAFLKYFEAPWFDAHAWFVALDGDEWVGISGLKPTGDPTRWRTAVTGVIRTHRRMGVATALKLRVIDFARRRGGHWIHTENEDGNPMLAINLRLGFETFSAWLDLEKPIG
jgi:GNAT superfamily N-acetyltransferase